VGDAIPLVFEDTADERLASRDQGAPTIE